MSLEIWQDGKLHSSLAPGKTSLDVTGLTPGAEYFFQLIARYLDIQGATLDSAVSCRPIYPLATHASRDLENVLVFFHRSILSSLHSTLFADGDLP